ncbi:MAG: NeuD/PglB/VioB family sugar acetyltransferase [Acidimicrobiia bacterium]|nr:NeuD/PglB/VioB family sugar acetyltransferase [Acidimicrobiia bacterium]MDH5238956.1 NeuD/PglB/VioB family sugar acetyltransferase [Acidimicrobiia bacterium]
MKPLLIVGAGGHAREAVDVAAAINERAPTHRLVGLVDDDPDPDLRGRSLTVVGPIEPGAVDGCSYVIAIGDPATRAVVAGRLGQSGTPVNLVHPLASQGHDVHLGPGAIVAAGARLTTNISVGVHVHLNPNVVVSHDCVLGDFVSCSPGVVLSGEVTVGSRVLLGSGAVVLPGCQIGDDVTVGAGAVVTGPVPSGATVVGAPARPTHEH